jgi:CDP-6-deoxy-D-xylo-4-hexulose-3-dehydrase
MCKNIKKKLITSGYPNADNVMKNGILLPVHHGMTEKMFNRLYETVDSFINIHT